VLFLMALVLLPMSSVQTTGGALVRNDRESRE